MATNPVLPTSFQSPKIRTTKQRRIPPGYIVGRLGGSHGDEQLIPLNELMRQLQGTPQGTVLKGVLGGDVTGPASANTVTALQGRPVSAAAPATNNVLTWNGSAWAPAAIPQQTQWGSFVIVDSTHYYVAMVVSLADPELVYAGGIPVYVLNPGFTP